MVCGWPGSVHDWRIFRNCLLKRRIEQNELLNGPTIDTIYGISIPQIIVADTGYVN